MKSNESLEKVRLSDENSREALYREVCATSAALKKMNCWEFETQQLDALLLAMQQGGEAGNQAWLTLLKAIVRLTPELRQPVATLLTAYHQIIGRWFLAEARLRLGSNFLV